MSASSSEKFAALARARITRWEGVREDADDAESLQSAKQAQRAAAGTLSLFGDHSK